MPRLNHLEEFKFDMPGIIPGRGRRGQGGRLSQAEVPVQPRGPPHPPGRPAGHAARWALTEGHGPVPLSQCGDSDGPGGGNKMPVRLLEVKPGRGRLGVEGPAVTSPD